jgi:hypothetical protein
MDYATAVEVFFEPAPDGAAESAPVETASPARRLRDACEPLGTHGFWSRLVNERLAARGLNFLTGYVWGRAAPMGEPVAPLVASAFAAFEPGLIGSLYDEARRVLPRSDMLALLDATTAESLRGILGGQAAEAEVADVGGHLRRAVEAADGTGRPLFSGVRALGWPADPFGQLWRACTALREHRGDSHIAAYVAAGFDPVEMNILTELWVGWPLGAYSATRAWPAERTDAALASLRRAGLLDGEVLAEAGRRARQDVEDRTDALEQPVVDAIGPDLDRVLERLNAWGAACIAAGAFPPNPLKRAAG